MISSDKWKIYCAKYQNNNIAALLLFYNKFTVEYFTPAILKNFRNFQPNALLIYTAMRDAITKGYKYWNWGGTWKNQKGVYNFKKKWGAKDMIYHYHTKVFQESTYNLQKEELQRYFNGFYVINFENLKGR